MEQYELDLRQRLRLWPIMAEIIGLTASLITLAGTGAKLADTLLKVANIIKSAECEASMLAADIQIFSASLTQLSKVLEASHPATTQLRDITVVLINACKALIEELRILIGDPLPYMSTGRSFSIAILRLRFRWLIHSAKVTFLKSLIDSFKFTTLLLVSSMDLATALHRHAPESITESFKAQVESNIEFAEITTQDLVRNENAQSNAKTNTQAGLKLPESPQRLQIQSMPPGADGTLTLYEPGGTCDNEKMGEQVALSIKTSAITLNELSDTSNRNSGDDEDDEDYHLQLSHECSRIFQVQKMADQLAKDILGQTTPQATWSWASPSPTQQPVIQPRNIIPGRLPTGIGSLPSLEAREDTKLRAEAHDQTQPTTPDSRRSPSSIALEMASGDADIRNDEYRRVPQAAGSPTSGVSPPPTVEIDSRDNVDSSEGTRQLPEPDWVGFRGQNRDPNLDRNPFHPSLDAAHFPPHTPPPRPPAPPPSSESQAPPPLHPEDPILAKLEAMLSKEGERRDREAEEAKFSRLERLLIEQQEARIAKEAAKKKAEEEAVIKAVEAKKRGDEDKLAKLEKLILAQKDEQLKREAAAQAAALAERAEHDARLAREAAEKAAAAEQANKLLDAAKKAKEEAERKAAKKAEETKAAHEQALREAREEALELEKAKNEAERAVAASPPIQIEYATGRRYPCPWKVGHSWKGVNKYLKEASFGVDAMNRLVESGLYDLVKDGLTIPPQQWEAMIHPGDVVTIRDRNKSRPSSGTKSKLPILVDAAKPLKKFSWLRKPTAKNEDDREVGLKRLDSSSSQPS
ncbi:hypothetical protein K458DRAFT_424945 [Lentithecium fluviatile CBS 122367]|uniref:Ubiquitin-like domain-containing protein n=1 Tax=Lentithecium fluviatile CBS 122367 TaxID=1168545 RepID=A0A6G1IDB3_9PLEO|nr:hypothetical protein K458DRAFT_424945 [Lentithecium fluviatile CBS 122367]